MQVSATDAFKERSNSGLLKARQTLDTPARSSVTLSDGSQKKKQLKRKHTSSLNNKNNNLGKQAVGTESDWEALIKETAPGIVKANGRTVNKETVAKPDRRSQVFSCMHLHLPVCSDFFDSKNLLNHVKLSQSCL